MAVCAWVWRGCGGLAVSSGLRVWDAASVVYPRWLRSTRFFENKKTDAHLIFFIIIMLELNIIAEPAPAPTPASQSKRKHRINNNNNNSNKRKKNKRNLAKKQAPTPPRRLENDRPTESSFSTNVTRTLPVATESSDEIKHKPLSTLQETSSHDKQQEKQEPQQSDQYNRDDNDEQLQNDANERAKHAEYLARFHPRIHELDRKSGAVKAAVPPSHSSKHLFETNDDDDDENDDEMMKVDASPLLPNVTTTITSATPAFTTTSAAAATDKPAPTDPWQRLQVDASFLTVLQRQSLSRPTIIQRRAIPFLLEQQQDHHAVVNLAARKNVLIQSETGSGKTLAYLLPILQNLMQQQQQQQVMTTRDDGGTSHTTATTATMRQSMGTKCIILVPTRELALQIFQVVQSFCNHVSSQFFATSNKNNRHADHHSNNGTLDSSPTTSLLPPSSRPSSTTSSCNFHLVAGCLSGGEKRKSEKARLRKGIHILVATPGRLLDHLQTTACFSWSGLRYLVLDEADRLVVDMHDAIQQIVETLQQHPTAILPNNSDGNHHARQPPCTTTATATAAAAAAVSCTWQTILVSATVTPKVQALAQDLLRLDKETNQNDDDWTRHWHWIKGATLDHKRVTNSKVGDDVNDENDDNEDDDGTDLADSTPRQLSHIHLTVSAKFRLSTLIAFLVQCVQRQERVVVFMSTCDGVDFHHALFQSMPCLLPSQQRRQSSSNTNGNDDDEDTEQSIFGSHGKIYKLHGNLPHPDRQVIMRQFTKTTATASSTGKTASILLATDVAARGLNLPHVDWIVQYDAPMEVSEYVHRAGRAARAGQAGHTLLFLLPSERGLLDVLQAKGVGVSNNQAMTALSLATVLEQAAKVCLPPSTLANTNSHRLGEAFCTEVHRQIEDCIWQDTKATGNINKNHRGNKRYPRTSTEETAPQATLSDMARAAFLSYMRAYPTKEKAIRPIFSVRALHVGHVAKSFGLKEAPTALAQHQRRHQQHQGETSQRRRNTAPEPDTKSGKKRNSALSFERDSSSQPFKKQRTSGAQTLQRLDSVQGKFANAKRQDKSKTNGRGKESAGKFKSGQAALMARATKLQQNGMDAF